MKLRVGVFSEDSFVNEALAAALARDSDMQVACRVSRLRGLKFALQRAQPDVVVIDTDLAPRKVEIHPLALTANTRDIAPKSHQVILITRPSLALITALLRESVKGIVVKGKDALPEILRAVAAARHGSVFLCPRSKQAVIATRTTPKLAKGDREILRLLARREQEPGFTRKEMARELVIAEGTLNARIAQLRTKLDVTNDEEIIALCRACGLIE